MERRERKKIVGEDETKSMFFFLFSQVIGTREDLSLSRSRNDRSNSMGRSKFDLQRNGTKFLLRGRNCILTNFWRKKKKMFF